MANKLFPAFVFSTGYDDASGGSEAQRAAMEKYTANYAQISDQLGKELDAFSQAIVSAVLDLAWKTDVTVAYRALKEAIEAADGKHVFWYLLLQAQKNPTYSPYVWDVARRWGR